MEPRELLSVMPTPIHVGTTYLEDSNPTDTSEYLVKNGVLTSTQVADLFEVSYTGGAPGSELTSLTINLKNNIFFNTSPSTAASYGWFPLQIVSHDGFQITSQSVAPGSSTMVLTFSGFTAGDMLVLTVRLGVDANSSTSTGITSVVEGADLQGSTFTADFTAPHSTDVSVTSAYYDFFDFSGTGLENVLPNDNYNNAAALDYVPQGASLGPVYTAGAWGAAQQEPLATLSGTVYYDLNADNQQESGEPGIAGVTVTLYSLNGNTYTSTGITTTTDANGNYEFADLAPGTYQVVETRPDGYVSVGDTPGTVNGQTRGTTAGMTTLIGINLNYGDDSIQNNFANTKYASVSGYVYVDANDNGVKDPGEAGLPAAQLTLLDANGNVLATTTTDSTGYYQFNSLMPGTYAVTVAQPAGYYPGLDSSGTAGGTAHNPGNLIDGIPLAGGVVGLNYNFGELLPASVGGTVFVDLNNNGVIDSGDTRLAGVTVYLEDSSGNIVDSTTTDSQGNYSFTDLQPGTYAVEEVPPGGYLENSDWIGSAGGQTDGLTRMVNINLGQGVAGTGYNFTETLPGTISGFVFQDGPPIQLQNGEPMPNIPSVRDGKLTANDPRLAGVTMVLCDGSGIPLTDAGGNQITTVTDANGYYQFAGLEPGMYSVKEVQPNGYVPGVDTAGTAGGLVVNTYTYSTISPQVLSTLAVTASDTVIAGIKLMPGDTATQYNFSEVLVNPAPPSPPVNPPPGIPPLVPPPAPDFPLLGPPMQLPGSDYTSPGIVSAPAPQIMMQPMFGGAAAPADYTWHLSVIDGGSPRNAALSDQFTAYTPTEYFDAAAWTGDNLDQGEFILADQNGVPIKRFHFGLRHATPVTGDWDGSGCTKVGVFLDGLWFFDLNGNGHWDENDLWAKLGKMGDQPVAGDWDGDGKTDIGIFGPKWIGDARAAAADPGLPDVQNTQRGRQKNMPPDPMDAAVGYRTMKHGKAGKLRSDLIDHVFRYGTKGDIAVVGDWNGDGVYTIGIFRNGTWFLDMDGDGRWSPGDVMFKFGQEGDLPVVGDWTGDGVSKVGVYRNGKFYLDTNNNHQLDAQDKVLELGSPGDKPVVGDWTGDGVDKVGVYHDAVPASDAGGDTGAVSSPAAADAAPPATVQ